MDKVACWANHWNQENWLQIFTFWVSWNEKASAIKKLLFIYTAPIACKRGIYISIVLQRLQNGSICLILLSLEPKVFVECPKIELFLPKIVLSDKQHFPDIFLLKSENRVGKYINTKLSNNIKGCIFYLSKWINPRFFVLLHWYSVCIWPGIKQFLCQCVPIYAGQWGVNIKKISTTAGRKMIIICIFA